MTARVFVPLVGVDGSGRQVFEALAGPVPPEAHPARLVPQISNLHDFGLYRIGQMVREAVTRVADARRARVWLGRRNARLRPWYLRISDLQVGRLSDENARSAGLGLATAALIECFGSRSGVVFATGALALPRGPGSLGTVAVEPVDGIAGKLALVGDYVLAHRAQLAGTTVNVLAPKLAADGRPLVEAEARTIDRLVAAGRSAGVAVVVHPIESLDDLEAVFGPFAAEPLLSRRAAAIGAAGMAVAAALATGWYALSTAPVALAWKPVDGAAGGPAEPRRAVYRADADRLELLPPCFDRQRQPVVVGGETLVLRVGSREGLALADMLAPSRTFIVSVSRAADPIILDASLFRAAGAELARGSLEDAVAAVPIEPAEDEVRLSVVATREQTVNLSALTMDLRARLAGLDGAAVLTTTAQFLKDRFDGQLDYQFRVTTDADLCPR